MPVALYWSREADLRLLLMRADGMTWEAVARALGVGRNAAIERARRLGVLPRTVLPPPAPAEPIQPSNRPPLCPGHPASWELLAPGQPYPHPVFL